MKKPFREWNQADVAAHEQHVASMKTAKQHNAELTGESNFTRSTFDNLPGDPTGSDCAGVIPVPGDAASVRDSIPELGKHIKAPAALSFKIDYGDIMGAVRQTRQDRWKKRPKVVRYHAYRDAIRGQVKKQNGGKLPAVPDGADMLFVIPMPKSWSKAKRGKMLFKPHQQRPDKDNLEKAVLDALFEEDGGIWLGSQRKVWGFSGEVHITLNYITKP